MTEPFVPASFDVPLGFDGPGFRLEPLGPQHNERDFEAWTSSLDHIRATPGFSADGSWPTPMSLDANRADLVKHAEDFESREGFTYSILDGDAVVGCVYIYPSRDPGHDADVRSWVRAHRGSLDDVVYRSLSLWLADAWPFESPSYAVRD